MKNGLIAYSVIVLVAFLCSMAVAQLSVADWPERSNDSKVSTPASRITSKDIILAIFGASGWGGFFLRGRMDKKKLENELLRQNDYVLNEPPLNEIRYEICKGDGPTRPGVELRQLPAFLEEIAIQCNRQVISFSTVKREYGDLFVKCANHKATWDDESPVNRDKYWTTFFEFVERLQSH